MSDASQIITASAEACRRARLYGCKLELHIGGAFMRHGPIRLTITPDPGSPIEPGQVLPDDDPAAETRALPAVTPTAQAAAEIPKRRRPIKDQPQA